MSRKGNPSISFRVSKELKRALEDEADAQSMDFSSYVREALSNRSDSQFNHKATLERIQQKNEKLQVQNKRLQEELNNSSSSDFEIQKQQIEQDYESQITELQNQLQEQLEAGSDNDLEKVKQDYEQTIDDLNQQVEQLETAVDTASEKVAEAYHEKINSLSEQVEELQASSENDSLLIEELRAELSNAPSINDLTVKQEVMQKELDATAEKLFAAKELLVKSFKQNQLDEEKIDQLTEDYNQLEEKSKSHKSKAKKAQEKNSELETNCQNLQENSEEMRQEIQRLKRENFTINDEVEALRESSNKDEVLELRKTVANLKKENEKLDEDRLSYFEQRTKVIRLNDTLEEEKEDLEERIENLEIELANAKRKRGTDAENEERKLLVEQLTTDTERYQQECEEKDSTIGDLVEQIEEHQSTIQMLQSQLENLEEDDHYDEEEEEYGEVATDDEDIEYQDEVEEEDDYIAYTEVIPVPSVTEFTEAENELYSELITELHVRYPHETIERLILGCLEANRANERGVLWTRTVAGGLKLLNSKV